ncbi:hypothetical protein F4808DRAFT_462769 [Astrocystis sublimbata]|nr:hypothetical protein F4808DRAFT_462769 [Astrocystis sublimbata]
MPPPPLPCSSHCLSDARISQPYHHVGEAIDDIARLAVRNTRKRLGLPASGDVGTLSKMIKTLRECASKFVNEPVSAAAVSIPYLAALYGEDLRDAFEHLSLAYIEFFPFSLFRPIHATITAYAGNGLGLCADYKDEACKEEESHIPYIYALAVSFTHTSLTTSQARVSDAYYLEEIPRLENLRLDYYSRHEEESYWATVRDMLRSPVLDSLVPRNISMVLISGDGGDDPVFRTVLQEVIDEISTPGEPPLIVDREPQYSAAKGTAELAKRAIFNQREQLRASSEL